MRSLEVDRFVLIVCAVGALLMAGLTVGAADVRAGGLGLVIFVAMGLAPYILTALLSAIRSWRRFVVATTRGVAVVYGIFDCGLRYVALYHPQGSTDSLVVVVLPFWWVPTLVVVAALTAATLWVRNRSAKTRSA
jgi:hypothetical protein